MKEAIKITLVFFLLSGIFYLVLDEMSKSGVNALQKQYIQETTK